jgi:hypothetical protein
MGIVLVSKSVVYSDGYERAGLAYTKATQTRGDRVVAR